jgi:heat shock protein HtpX
MKMAKRIFLFASVNILIVVTISVVTSMLGLQPYLSGKGIDYTSLLIFCGLWGFGGAFISLAISRKMAKWMMGVQVISSETRDPQLRSLVNRVHDFSRRAGLTVMPEVGYYESPEANAFATGPTKKRALVAVSTGLLTSMSQDEVDGVLAHEVAHIANGDMVTMTLVQGVVNAFVMFLARVAAFFVGQLVEEERRPMVQFGVTIGLEIVLGILGMLVVSAFSRRREYRADSGGAHLAGTGNMIAALEKLKKMASRQAEQGEPAQDDQPALASFKISGRPSRWLRLFSTHPDIEDRIQRLQKSTFGPRVF